MAGCKNVKSVGFIGLAKKCYVHKLEGIDELTGEIKDDYHRRLKGASDDVITIHITDVQKKDENYNCWQMYKAMYGGTTITLDNAANNKHRMSKNKAQEYLNFFGNRKRNFKF